ncbi:MAG: ABC transporter substrate-binding protein [Spirochaetes bacterium]|nr:ABC transporter substrate-binding protein [Spirochaetota bacterium]
MKRSVSILLLVFFTLQVYALGSKEAAITKESLSAAETESRLPDYIIKAGALKGPTGIGMIYLFENPPVLPQQTSVQSVAVPAADIMAAKLMSGELDIAVLPVNMAAKLYNAGLDLVMAAVVGNGMVQVISADPGLNKLEELQGRTVYVAGQSATPDFLLRSLLQAQNIDPTSDLTLSYQLPIPEIAASLIAGRIETAILPEPFATMVLKGNPALRQAFPLAPLWTALSGLDDYPMSVLVVRASLARERPQAISAFMQAYKESISKVLAEPAAAGILVEKYDMGLKAGIAEAAIPRSNYVYIEAPEARASIEALLKLFLAAAPASVGGSLPAAGFYLDINAQQ